MLHSHVRLLILAVATLAASTTAAASLTKRMTSGILVKSPEDYPFMASLRLSYKESTGSIAHRGCAAMIISDRHVMTNSLCIYNETTGGNEAKNVSIQVGSLNPVTGPEHIIEKMYWPPWLGLENAPNLFHNQFLAILVKPAFQLGKTIQPIKISTVPVKDDEQLTIVGWGNDGSTAEWRTTLATGSAQVVSDAVCKTAWNKAIPDHPWLNREDGEYFCTSGSIICPGDLGSLLIRKEKKGYSAVGIGSSVVSPAGNTSDCTANGAISIWLRPSVFTTVISGWMGQSVESITTDGKEGAVSAPSPSILPVDSSTPTPSNVGHTSPSPPSLVDSVPPVTNADDVSQLQIGRIVGIVAGVLVALTLIVAALLYIRYRRRITQVSNLNDSSRLSLVSTADPKELYLVGNTSCNSDPISTAYQHVAPLHAIHPVYIAPDMLNQPAVNFYNQIYTTGIPTTGPFAIVSTTSPVAGPSDSAFPQQQQSTADGSHAPTPPARESVWTGGDDDAVIQWQPSSTTTAAATSPSTVPHFRV